MALALRLTTLSYVVAHANARWFQMGSSAGDWAPVTPTAGASTLRPDEWVPRTTSAPDRPAVDWELRRRDDGMSTICGYSVGNLDGPAVTCDSGKVCRLDRVLGIVGCCTGTNPRGCIVPTTCLESSRSALWSGDPLTVYCSDSARPHCVTHSYDASFYDPLYGAYFIGCAAKAASGDIVVSLVPASETTSVTPLQSSSTTTNVVPSSSGRSSGSLNVGAIAGGVVGGVAGLALIVAAIFFFFRRRKKRSEDSNALALGRKMPPSDHDMYPNEPIPGSQYPSTFYGEAPPGMAQTSGPPMLSYQPNVYGVQIPIYNVGSDHIGHDHGTEVPMYYPPRAGPGPPKPQDDGVSPLEESPVSPVSPADNYNTMVSALSTQLPPLQPPPPAARHQQSEYAPYSPPPPEQYQSYHPYPGT